MPGQSGQRLGIAKSTRLTRSGLGNRPPVPVLPEADMRARGRRGSRIFCLPSLSQPGTVPRQAQATAAMERRPVRTIGDIRAAQMLFQNLALFRSKPDDILALGFIHRWRIAPNNPRRTGIPCGSAG